MILKSLFSDVYIHSILRFEFFLKFFIFLSIFLSGIIQYIYSDFHKYELYIFSRLYRNIRFNFFYFGGIISTYLYKYLKNRKSVMYFVDSFNLGMSYSFYIIFDILLIEIFRIFFRYSLSFFAIVYGHTICFSWYDIYTNLIDLNDLIIYRDLFYFKYDIPKIIFKLNIYNFFGSDIKNVSKFLCLLSFFGLNFFFRKRIFRFKFFSRIV